MRRLPEPGDRWLVRHRLPLAHEVVEVVAVESGKHNLDKGPTAPPPDDVVVSHLVALGGRLWRCPMTAFLRTCVLEAEVLADAS